MRKVESINFRFGGRSTTFCSSGMKIDTIIFISRQLSQARRGCRKATCCFAQEESSSFLPHPPPLVFLPFFFPQRSIAWKVHLPKKNYLSQSNHRPYSCCCIHASNFRAAALLPSFLAINWLFRPISQTIQICAKSTFGRDLPVWEPRVQIYARVDGYDGFSHCKPWEVLSFCFII